jgi:hypothetical protein
MGRVRDVRASVDQLTVAQLSRRKSAVGRAMGCADMPTPETKLRRSRRCVREKFLRCCDEARLPGISAASKDAKRVMPKRWYLCPRFMNTRTSVKTRATSEAARASTIHGARAFPREFPTQRQRQRHRAILRIKI